MAHSHIYIYVYMYIHMYIRICVYIYIYISLYISTPLDRDLAVPCSRISRCRPANSQGKAGPKLGYVHKPSLAGRYDKDGSAHIRVIYIPHRGLWGRPWHDEVLFIKMIPYYDSIISFRNMSP